MNVLFVTWDGPQVAYLESLFLPIFAGLAQRGVRFHVVQFTWADNARLSRARAACAAAGVGYRSLPVWRRPKAAGALASALAGSRAVRRAIRDFDIDVVMPRSNLPGLAVLACGGSGRPMVFDADGLPLDEAVEFAGRSPRSFSHRLLRDIEAQLVQRAAVVLTRTGSAARTLAARAGAGIDPGKFRVVGNGRDPAVFHPGDAASRALTRSTLDVADRAPLAVYAGSLGDQYCPAEMLDFIQALVARRSDARCLVLTGQPEVMERHLSQRPALSGAVIVRRARPEEVPAYLACADIGLAFRRPSFSMKAVAPVKLGEYLLCGVPVLATRDIGDTGAIGTGAGLLLDAIDATAVEAAADWVVDALLPDRDGFRERCVATGKSGFSLDATVSAYAQAFEEVRNVR